MIKLKLTALAAVVLMTAAAVSCDNENTTIEDSYKDWREYNEQWMTEQSALKNPDGTPYYTTVVSPTDPDAFVLVHVFGHPNVENLKPLFTSTVKVNYTLKLANDTVADQNAGFVSQLNSSGLIVGWALGIMQLHVGDSAQVIIPYTQGYGTSGSGTGIAPYSNLQFNLRLVDITAYEVRP